MIHIGVLGAGNISDTHARAAISIPGVAVTAVFGQNRARATALASRVGAAAHDTLDSFLAHRPMDIVAIGSPSGLHAAQAIDAVRRGLHVLVEKPIDTSLARIDQLADEATRAGVKTGVFFQDRLRPDVLRIKQLIEAGRLGTPVMASGRVKWYRPPEYYGASKWRGTWALDGGGALMNQAIHTADLMLWLFGPVARATARTATRLHRIEVEDTAAAILDFESGALGVLEAATSIYPGYSRRLELTGAEGTLVLEGDRLIAADLQAPPPAAEDAPVDTSATQSPVVADASAHRRVIEDFIDAVSTGRTPACDAREARKSVALIQAIYQSAREGRTIQV